VHGFWAIFFLLVVLKVPVFGALWLVWWASREPEPEGAAGDDSDGGGGRWSRGRPRPRGPHGGPYGGGARRRMRTRPAQLVSDRRERVATDGRASASRRTSQAG